MMPLGGKMMPEENLELMLVRVIKSYIEVMMASGAMLMEVLNTYIEEVEKTGKKAF